MTTIAIVGAGPGLGVQAKDFQAGVRDPAELAKTLESATDAPGPIEVLQYGPPPQKDFMRSIMETTPVDLVGPVEFFAYGRSPRLGSILWDLPVKRDRCRTEIATG